MRRSHHGVAFFSGHGQAIVRDLQLGSLEIITGRGDPSVIHSTGVYNLIVSVPNDPATLTHLDRAERAALFHRDTLGTGLRGWAFPPSSPAPASLGRARVGLARPGCSDSRLC